VAARLEDIILAQTLVRRRERDLKRIMQRDDLPMAGEAEVITTTPPNPLLLTLDAAALADAAVAGRMETLELELQITIDSLNVDVARNETLPLVALDYTYAFAGSGRAIDDAFDEAFDVDESDWSIGVNVEVPLGNQAARSRLRRTRKRRLTETRIRH